MSTYPEVVKAILTNTTLNEDEKSILISKMIEEFKEHYPELHNHTTKNDIKELELKVEEVRKDVNEIKLEIQKVRNEGKDSELKLTKDIEKTRLDLRKEIEKVRLDLKKEIEKVKLDLTKEIGSKKSETIKWVSALIIGQTFAIAGIVAGIFKFFTH